MLKLLTVIRKGKVTGIIKFFYYEAIIDHHHDNVYLS